MKKAIYAGSFDLPTIGHIWMINEGRKIFDELIVGVGINPNKSYTFTQSERIKMMKTLTTEVDNVIVVDMCKEYLITIAELNNSQYILRGLRSSKDFDEEIDLRDFNNKFISCYLIPPPEYRKISSSFVKGLIGYNGWEEKIKNYVPWEIKEKIINKFKYKCEGW